MINKTQGKITQSETRHSLFPGVPLIDYKGLDISNVQDIRDDLANAFISKYGETANFIKSGVAYDEPEIMRPEKTGDKAEDEASIKRYYKALERRDVRVEEGKALLPKIYADLMLHTTKESEAIIKEHPEFRDIDRASNPMALWAMIIASHTFKNKDDIVEAKDAAWTYYYSMVMSETDNLFNFKRTIDTALAGIGAVGETPPTSEQQAHHFSTRLSNKYATLKLNYKNKLKDRPTTLAEAYKLATEHRVLSKEGTAVSVNQTNHATVFVTKGVKEAPSINSDTSESSSSDEEEPETPSKKKKKK